MPIRAAGFSRASPESDFFETRVCWNHRKVAQANDCALEEEKPGGPRPDDQRRRRRAISASVAMPVPVEEKVAPVKVELGVGLIDLDVHGGGDARDRVT